MTEFGASSTAGPRPSNEDGYLTFDLTPQSERLGGLRALLVVADGMGGHAMGELASRSAIEGAQAYAEGLIGRALADPRSEVEPFELIWELISVANAAVMRASREAGGAQMGCTIVAALVGQDRVWVGHVGDSRAYHLNSNGARQVTTDHSRVARMVAEGILTESQAADHPMRNVVERALGFEGALPDFGKVWLEPGDALVLATDGLFTVLSAEQIAALAASAETVQSAAQRLTEAAVAAGTDDNTTALVWAADWNVFRRVAANLVSAPTSPPPTQEAIPTGAGPMELASAPGAKSSWRSNRRAQAIYLGVLGVVLVAAAVLVFAATRSGGGGTAIVTSSSGTVVSLTTTSMVVFYDIKPHEGVYLRRQPEIDEINVWAQTTGDAAFVGQRASNTDGWYMVFAKDLGPEDYRDPEGTPPEVLFITADERKVDANPR